MSVVSVDKDYDAHRLVVVAEFAAPIEQVWQLWADPRKLERWWGPPSHPATFERHDLAKVLTHDDLVKGEDVFFSATGVTDGDVLQGVRYEGARGASTESLVMRSRSGTVRRIQSRHDRTKLRELAGFAGG